MPGAMLLALDNLGGPTMKKLLLCLALAAGCGGVNAAPAPQLGASCETERAEIVELQARVAYLTREVDKVRENARRSLAACPPK